MQSQVAHKPHTRIQAESKLRGEHRIEEKICDRRTYWKQDRKLDACKDENNYDSIFHYFEFHSSVVRLLVK